MEQDSKQQGQTGKPNSFSEQFAKMAAQQEAIRKMLQDYNEEIKRQNGVGDKGIEQMLREMEATEKDLVPDINVFLQHLQQVKPYLINPEQSEQPHKQSPQQLATLRHQN